jgi:hypothetical protein
MRKRWSAGIRDAIKIAFEFNICLQKVVMADIIAVMQENRELYKRCREDSGLSGRYCLKKIYDTVRSFWRATKPVPEVQNK